MSKKFLYLSFICLVFGLLSCGDKPDKKEIAAAKADSLLKAETTNNQVVGVGKIEPEAGIINLAAGNSGKVVAVLVKENDEVTKGQPLLSLDLDLEKAQLNQAQSKIAAQRALIDNSSATIEAKKADISYAQQILLRNKDLLKAGAITGAEVDQSQNNVNRLSEELRALQASFRQNNQRVGELNADISYYKTILNEKQILAPAAGKILMLDIKAGEYVTNATKIGELSPSGALIAKTEVDELYADRIQIGQKAEVFSQATGASIAKGTVSFAGSYLKAKSLFKDQSTELEDRRVREVHIRLQEGTNILINSRVDCTIYLK